MEQALRHVLSEQGKLLKRADSSKLVGVALRLSNLASMTSGMLAEGFNRSQKTDALTKEAKEVEVEIDALSEELWTPIQISVSAIYERIEKSMQPQAGQHGFAAEVRAHYHNLRLRLLEQMIGARMLAQSSDLGEETERIWQQFLERHLGPMFRVLRGGYVCDHLGNKSSQMDLLVVPSDAQIFVPGDSEGGKAHVLIDQIISVSMVTANLTTKKLRSDCEKLQSLPIFADQDKDYPNLKGHPWPLCYVLAAQSDPIEELKKEWVNMCRGEVPTFLPQFVVTLDEGFLYSGLRKWPCPRISANYATAKNVQTETGIYGGLGLAWLVTQHRGRLAVIEHQAFGPINRYAQLLQNALMREGVPPTYSRRFDTMFQMLPVGGVMEWGSVANWVHNGVQLRSLARKNKGAKSWWECELLRPGVDPHSLNGDSAKDYLRWFRYPVANQVGRLVAIEEWLTHESKADHRRRVAVFEAATGEEIMGPLVDALKSPFAKEGVFAEIEAGLPARPNASEATG